MAITLRVRDWDKHFENNRTRELKKLDWCPFPNKHDGDGFTELMDHENGGLHYAAWCLIVQVASKCDPRGTLMRDGKKPHDSASLERITRLDRGVFDAAIPRLLLIGWLEAVDESGQVVTQMSQEGAGMSHQGAALESQEGALNGREGNGREGNLFCGETGEAPARPRKEDSPVVLTFPCDGPESEWHLRQSLLEELTSLYPSLDVQGHCRDAYAWVLANKSKRKTANGMRRFLTNWLIDKQNRGGGIRGSPAKPSLTDVPFTSLVD